MHGKDLTGFVDGTRNVPLDDTILISDDNEHISGSYLYVGQYQHNLNKFNQLNPNEKK